MQTHIILFTRESKIPFSKAQKEVSTYLKNAVKSNFIDLKKEFIHEQLIHSTMYITVHLGKKNTIDSLQELSSKIIKQIIAKNSSNKPCSITVEYDKSIDNNEIYFLEKGLLLGQKPENAFKSKSKSSKITIKGIKNKDLQAIVEAIDIARDLTMQPSNILTPNKIASFAREIVKNDKNLKIKILKEAELKKEKMNMHLAVNAGSPNEAQLIIIEYTPQKKKSKNSQPFALVGKGLMYDSGGLYHKPYPHMNNMHGDMAGAATVIGIMSALSKLKVSKKVVAVCGIAENLIDAHSYRNGDIITARNGKTVEVLHTDAEGRLVLADALDYVSKKYKPEMIFDIATLTGAVIYSLGEMYTGIFSDNTSVLSSLKKAGQKVNDKAWDLPYDDDIKESVKGQNADLTNATKLQGMLGASTAAAFLSNFVQDTKKWVHFDIAGTAHREKMKKSYDMKNALGTGASVHLILEYLQENYK